LKESVENSVNVQHCAEDSRAIQSYRKGS
jgi:hypothetical protein